MTRALLGQVAFSCTGRTARPHLVLRKMAGGLDERQVADTAMQATETGGRQGDTASTALARTDGRGAAQAGGAAARR